MGVEAAESGNNSITEENTGENEETEDSTGADDEKMVRDNFSKDKMFWIVGMFVHPKIMLIYILYFLPMQDDQFLEKHSFSCNAKNLSHFFSFS